MKDLASTLFADKDMLLPRYTREEKKLRGILNEGNIKLLIISYTDNVEDEGDNKRQTEILNRLTERLPEAARPVHIYYTELKQFDINIFFTCTKLNSLLFCGVIPYIKGRVINKAELTRLNTKHTMYFDGIEVIDKDAAQKKLMWNQLISTFK